MTRNIYSSMLLCLCTLLSACSYHTEIFADASGPMRVEEMASVVTSPLQVSLRPKGRPHTEPRAIIVPIRMMHPVANATDISRSITWEIWNICLSNKVFTQIEYASSQVNISLKDALRYAKARNATVLITGMSNYFLDGGSVGTSRVALNLQIYDVATGGLLWSLHQSGELKSRERMDYIVGQKQTILPNNPIGTIIATLVDNMVQPVKLWRNSRPHFTAESL